MGGSWRLCLTEYLSGDHELSACYFGEVSELQADRSRKATCVEEQDERTKQAAVSRARKAIKRKVLQMGADRMLTLTFRENQGDIDEAWKAFKALVRKLRKTWKDFTYLAVPEKQKRGAWHFHLALSGYHDVSVIRQAWVQVVGTVRVVGQLAGFSTYLEKSGGNVDITKPRKQIDKNSWNPANIAGYLGKYLAKTFETVESLNRRRYSSGGDIPEPKKVVAWCMCGGSWLYDHARKVFQDVHGYPPAYEVEIDEPFKVLFLTST